MFVCRFVSTRHEGRISFSCCFSVCCYPAVLLLCSVAACSAAACCCCCSSSIPSRQPNNNEWLPTFPSHSHSTVNKREPFTVPVGKPPQKIKNPLVAGETVPSCIARCLGIARTPEKLLRFRYFQGFSRVGSQISRVGSSQEGCCCCCCCCCSHINSHNQVRDHRTGSSHSRAEEYPREKMQTNQRWFTHVSRLTQFMPSPETYKKRNRESAYDVPGPYWTMVHTSHYPRLEKPTVYRLPPKKDYHVYITRSTYHYAYARQTQVNWKTKTKKV